jgi:YbbR domain-containing protein
MERFPGRTRLKRNKPLFEQLIANWPAKALSLAAAIMLFLFHNFATLSERIITVSLEARFAEGYTAAQQYPRKVRVIVRGKERSLGPISEEDIEAVADFSRYASEGPQKVPVIVTKKGTLEELNPLEIRVEPLEIGVRIERKIRKRVEVVPNLKGFPSSGFSLAQYFVTPAFVDVDGPRSLVDVLGSIATADIDLSGKKDSFSARVRLFREDPLLLFPGGDVVEFRGIIEEEIILKTIDAVNIIALDLRGDFRIEGNLENGSLRVQGGRLLLENIRPDQIRLAVDCSGITSPGVYTLPVKTDVPMGILVLKYEPTLVTLDIRSVGRQSF